MNSTENEYEIINNRKLKKCKENQIRNPITQRCVLKTSEIGKKIMSIDKKCPENKILNYKTNKCVLKTSALGKKLLNDKYKKLKKIIRKKHIPNDIAFGIVKKNIKEL